jgi:hypothetical protein
MFDATIWLQLLIGFNIGVAVTIILRNPIKRLWAWTKEKRRPDWRKAADKPGRGMYIGLRRNG